MSAPEDRVSSRYGAPMGRGEDPDLLAGKVSLRRVRLKGDYDQGGAYWGRGQPLYYAEGSDGGYRYVRGLTRDDAKRALFSQLEPNARWYR